MEQIPSKAGHTLGIAHCTNLAMMKLMELPCMHRSDVILARPMTAVSDVDPETMGSSGKSHRWPEGKYSSTLNNFTGPLLNFEGELLHSACSCRAFVLKAEVEGFLLCIGVYLPPNGCF